MQFLGILLKAPFDNSPAVSTTPGGCSFVFLLPISSFLPCIATRNFMAQSLFVSSQVSFLLLLFSFLSSSSRFMTKPLQLKFTLTSFLVVEMRQISGTESGPATKLLELSCSGTWRSLANPVVGVGGVLLGRGYNKEYVFTTNRASLSHTVMRCCYRLMGVPSMLRTLMFTLDMRLSESNVSSDSVCWRGCRWLLASWYLQDVLSYRSSVSGMTDNCNQCGLSTIPSQSKADDGFRRFVWWSRCGNY